MTDIQEHLYSLNNCTCTDAQDTCSVYATLNTQMHMHLRKHAHTTVQQLLCHANYCDPCCNLSYAQETIRIHGSPWRSRSYVVTQASSDHLHCCGSHPPCLWFALALDRELRTLQNFISTILSQFFSDSLFFEGYLPCTVTVTPSMPISCTTTVSSANQDFCRTHPTARSSSS